MGRMNILVVGRGWLGKKMYTNLLSRGYRAILVDHKEALEGHHLAQHDLNWVVNCAGVTGTPNVDACEHNKRDTIEGNAIFPVLLHQKCDEAGVRFAHFSSGCIYQGAINSVFDDPNFFGSIYSISKGISDSYLKDKAVVFRIRMPFTGVNEQKNYLTKVYKYAETAMLIDAGQNSMTDLDEAVDVACDLLEEQTIDGPYNLVNAGSINMHELAAMMGIDPAWYTPEEFRKVTTAARSTCVIPSVPRMVSLDVALRKAISKMNRGRRTG